MICVFCGERGSGKTKQLVRLANEKALTSKGNLVYIDEDIKTSYQLKNRIRFISTEEFHLKDYNSFYGFLCGILSEDYDIESVFIDSLCNIVDESLHDAAHLFYHLEEISERYQVDFYINVSRIEKDMPEFVKKYIA